VPPTLDGEEVDITEQLVSSILEQGHLCPLPLHVRPIYWELDYTLRLTPLPHLVRLQLSWHAAEGSRASLHRNIPLYESAPIIISRCHPLLKTYFVSFSL
jgi:DNA polymerase alpha/epsilon subunit B